MKKPPFPILLRDNDLSPNDVGISNLPAISLHDDLARAANIPLPPSLTGSESQNLKPEDGSSSLWDIYKKHAELFDSEMLFQSNADMDILLIFAGLFTAIVTAFAISSLGDLKENYAATSAQLLSILVAQSMGQHPVFQQPTPFQPDYATVVVNSLWIASIIVSLSAALCAILCKQWLREYGARLSPIPSIRALQRHSRFRAFERWQVPTIIALLPALLHAAVGLFFAGLIVYLRPVNDTVLTVASVMIGVTTTAYLAFFVLPLLTMAPFITPLESLCINFALKGTALVFRLVVNQLMVWSTSIFSRFRIWQFFLVFGTLVYNIMLKWVRKLFLQRIYDQQTSPLRDGESSRADMLSWLLYSPLEDSEIEAVAKALSTLRNKDALRTLGEYGASTMLLNRMESISFSHDGPSRITGVIMERLPLILSCLDCHVMIASTRVREVDDPFWSITPAVLIGSLLKVTNGVDRLRVLAASTWMVARYSHEGRDYRQQIRNHLLAHVDGAVELPENIITRLIQDPAPLAEFAPDVIRLLQKYLDGGRRPSMSTIYEILLHLYFCHERFLYRRQAYLLHSSYLVAYLMKHVASARPQLLQLLRSFSPNELDLRQTPEISLPTNCLLDLLEGSTRPYEPIILDILKTISKAPEWFRMGDHALVRLARFHRAQMSPDVRCHASIVALASLTESIVNSGPTDPDHKTSNNDLRIVCDIITDSLIASSDHFNTEREAIVPYLYILDLCASPTIGVKRTKDDILLPYLINHVVSIPHSQLDIVVMQLTLHLISLMLHDNIGSASRMTDSLDLWMQLVVHDDVCIRWLSFDIVKRVAYHLSREDSRRMFRVVRDDVERRLNSATTEKFVDSKWVELLDATPARGTTVSNPMIALSRQVNVDIEVSGIREVLNKASELEAEVICEKSVLGDFPSLKPFDNWAGGNLSPNIFVA